MNPIAVIFVLMALAVMAPLGVHIINSETRQTLSTAAALQMARIEKAAEGYITANASAIESASSATTPATITIAALENTGYLPNGFSATNPYGQTWEVQVLQPSPGQLQALVLATGGNAVDTRSLGQAAQIAGASGGVIGGGSGDTAVPGCGSGQACGVYAGWKVSTAGYDAAPGHLAALIEYSNGQVQNDYLYRVSVPGQPQLNQMQTNLDMGNNNVNNAQNVNVNNDVTLGNPGPASGGYAASLPGQLGVNEPAGQGFPSGWGGGIHTWDEYANGTISTGEDGYQATNMNGFNNVGSITAQDANNGNYVAINTGNTGSNPELYTNGIIDAGNGIGAGNYIGMDNGSWWASNNGNTSQSGSASINGNIYTNGQVYFNNQYAQPGWGCSQDGEMMGSTYNGGTLLVCQNGSWQNAQQGQVQIQQFGFGDFCNAVNCAYYPVYLGWFNYCAISGYGQYNNAYAETYIGAGPNAQGQYLWMAQSQSANINGVTFTCFNE